MHEITVKRDELERLEANGRDFIDAAVLALPDEKADADVTRITELGDRHVQIELDDGDTYDVTLEATP
jgi:hypothetical protein